MTSGVPHIEQRERSAEEVRAVVGERPDLVLVRGLGNVGDQLILQGTRALFSDRHFREIALEELGRCEGGTALIVGGGAFSAAYHEWARWALQVAETRFDQVIVLPTTFEVSVPEVRDALAATRAMVFARESESFAAIRDLCDARLAFDAAFHYGFEPQPPDGSGVLNAFRTDREAPETWPLPPDNNDISRTAAGLSEWLEAIVAHATVRTNRTHVMIAAAMLGKPVELGPCRSGKLQAIADYSLANFPVRRIEAQAPARSLRAHPATTGPRVTAAIVSGEGLGRVLGALESALEDPHTTALVLDGGSPPDVRAGLADAVGSEPRVRLEHERVTDLAAVATDYTLVLDCEAELRPGAIATLVAELDAHPAALAATPSVWRDDGRTRYCGGELCEGGEVVEFRLNMHEGSCDWAPPDALLVRRGAFAEFALDPGMPTAYQNREWAYRINRRHPEAFRACPEGAVVLHRPPPAAIDTSTFHGRCTALPSLIAMARFHGRHGRVLRADLARMLPSLVAVDGAFDLAGARLLLTVLDQLGPARFLALWCGGELEPVIGAERWAGATRAAEAEAELARMAGHLEEIRGSRIWRLAGSYYRMRSRAVRLADTLRTS